MNGEKAKSYHFKKGTACISNISEDGMLLEHIDLRSGEQSLKDLKIEELKVRFAPEENLSPIDIEVNFIRFHQSLSELGIGAQIKNKKTKSYLELMNYLLKETLGSNEVLPTEESKNKESGFN